MWIVRKIRRGVFLASDGLYIVSNGNVGTNHKYYRESHDKLAKAQCRLSCRQGSKKHEGKLNNYILSLATPAQIVIIVWAFAHLVPCCGQRFQFVERTIFPI